MTPQNPRPSTIWAQNEDWARYRPIIADMYLGQRKRLVDVRQTMAEEYGFRATIKMYKTRFQKWGLAKNARRKPTPAPKRLVSARPGMRSTAPPDFYKCAEDAFRFAQVYVSSTKVLTPTSSALPTMASEWLSNVTTARTLFTLGHHQRAFLLVDICCHQYRSVLNSQDISQLVVTLGAILAFLRHGPGLVEAFVRFAYEMSQIVLGASHPLSILFNRLKAAGADNLPHCISIIVRHCLIPLIFGVCHPIINPYGDIYSDLIYHKIFDVGAMRNEIQGRQHRLQENQSDLRQRQALQCRLAWLHYYAGHYEDASRLALGILGQLTNAHEITGCYDLLYNIALAEGKHELALEMIEKAVATSVAAYGHARSVTTDKMARLESHLRTKGLLEEAETVRRDSEMHLEQIRREVCPARTCSTALA